MIGEVKKDDLYGIPISCVMFSPALTWQELLLPITVDACKVSAFTDLVFVSAIWKHSSVSGNLPTALYWVTTEADACKEQPLSPGVSTYQCRVAYHVTLQVIKFSWNLIPVIIVYIVSNLISVSYLSYSLLATLTPLLHRPLFDVLLRRGRPTSHLDQACGASARFHTTTNDWFVKCVKRNETKGSERHIDFTAVWLRRAHQ